MLHVCVTPLIDWVGESRASSLILSQSSYYLLVYLTNTSSIVQSIFRQLLSPNTIALASTS